MTYDEALAELTRSVRKLTNTISSLVEMIGDIAETIGDPELDNALTAKLAMMGAEISGEIE